MKHNEYPNILILDFELNQLQDAILETETLLEALKSKQRSVMAKRAKQLVFNEAMEDVSK